MTKDELLKALKDFDFSKVTEEGFEHYAWEKLPYDIDWGCGVSKAVLYPDDKDYVIKIPFNGSFEPTDNLKDDWLFSPFQNARDGGNGRDYCKAEILLYQKAIEYGDIADLFAETRLLTTIKGYPIYTQKLCVEFDNCEEAYTSKPSEAIRSLSSTGNFVNQCDNLTWWGDVLTCYGEKVLNKLSNFISEYGISDLHDGNIGYYQGRPIIIDYAGFAG